MYFHGVVSEVKKSNFQVKIMLQLFTVKLRMQIFATQVEFSSLHLHSVEHTQKSSCGVLGEKAHSRKSLGIL